MLRYLFSHLKSESQSDDDDSDDIANPIIYAIVKSGVGPPTPSQNNFSDDNPN